MTIETNIGSQCWFAENLRTARYPNGEPEHWVTNESGFNGLPGGSYNYTRGFFSVGEQGIWWSSSQDQSAGEYAMMRYLSHNVSNVR